MPPKTPGVPGKKKAKYKGMHGHMSAISPRDASGKPSKEVKIKRRKKA